MAPTPLFLNSSEPTSDPHAALIARLRELKQHHLALRIEDCAKRFGLRASDKRILPIWCRSKLCPICAERLAREAFQKYQPRLAAVMGQSGEAYLLTLTAPADADDAVAMASRMHKELRGFTSDSWWKARKSRCVGILTALEFGWEHGQAHGHQLVVAPKPDDAAAVVDALLSRWLQRNPEAVLAAQDTLGPLQTPDEMKRALIYLVKGSRIGPHWADETILAAVATLSNGSHPLTACGLAYGSAPALGQAGVVF